MGPCGLLDVGALDLRRGVGRARPPAEAADADAYQREFRGRAALSLLLRLVVVQDSTPRSRRPLTGLYRRDRGPIDRKVALACREVMRERSRGRRRLGRAIEALPLADLGAQPQRG